MTAVMRSLVPAVGPTPRVLRVGVVQGGIVRDERLFERGVAVTIGRSERATFVTETPDVPAFTLFEESGEVHYLRLAPGMRARIAMAGGVGAVRELTATTKAERVRLAEDARGKIVCGATTFLFQLVEAPAVRPRAQLPLSVKSGLVGSIDWSLTILVALSFLLHFGVIGAMYSDWADPIVNEDVTAGGLIDMVKTLPVAEPEQNDVEPVAPSAAPEAPVAAARPAATRRADAPSSADAAGRARAEPADSHRLAAQAEDLHMQLLGVAKSGTALDGVVTRSDLPAVDLAQVAVMDVGVVRTANGDLRMTTADGPLHPGTSRHGLGDIATTRQTADVTAGKETRTAGPRIDALLEPSIPTVPVSHADAVIAGLRPGFRRCYMLGLDADSGMGGKVVLVAQIAPNGEVSGTDVQSNTGLSSKVVQCLARKVQGAQFEKPGATGSKLVIPITLVQQAR